MAYIGWAVNVNKIILNSTKVTVGDGATVQDALEAGGQKKSRLVCANPPDKFSVTMTFNCVDKGLDHDGHQVGDNLTEYERFTTWLKWHHCYGANPFQFPAILLNSNRQEGFSTEEAEHIMNRIANGDTTVSVPDYEYYRITSAAEGEQNGNDISVSMTWETYATGAITIPDDNSAVDHIEPENGCVKVILTSPPSTEPTKDTWQLYIKSAGGYEFQQVISLCIFDGDVSAYLYFPKIPSSSSGTYMARIGDHREYFTVT